MHHLLWTRLPRRDRIVRAPSTVSPMPYPCQPRSFCACSSIRLSGRGAVSLADCGLCLAAGGSETGAGTSSLAVTVKQAARCHPYGLRELFESRNLRVALPALDSAHLARLDAAAFCDLFLRQAEPFAGRPQVLAEVAHVEDRPL